MKRIAGIAALGAVLLAACSLSDLPGSKSVAAQAAPPVLQNEDFHTPREFFAARVQPALEFCRSCHLPGGAGDTGDGPRFLMAADRSMDYDRYYADWSAFGHGIEDNRILVRTSTPDEDSDNGLGRWPVGSANYNNTKILFTCWEHPRDCDALLAKERIADTAVIADVDCVANDCAQAGGFTPPFSEPRVTQGGPAVEGECEIDAQGVLHACKPAAVHLALLEDDRIMYYNGLEGYETQGLLGLLNDQSRVMTIKGSQARWSWPAPVDGLEYSGGNSGDSAWFCSDLSQLPDGGIVVSGGTDYVGQAGSESGTMGLLAGIRNTSLFDALSNAWRRITDMVLPRWYPSTITMPDGKVMAFSGAAQVIFPIYPQRPLDSLRNEVRSETYDPASGMWSDNGRTADRSLPLYPRMHLLPNGQVFYNGSGEAWNPAGFAYDQVAWNLVASYDPASARWTELGFAGLPITGGLVEDPVSTLGAGFRGSTFSLMLPLQPDEQGRYTKAEFLTAGGVLGAPLLTSPGSYLATRFSRVDTVTLDGARPTYASRLTGSLHAPRWFGTGVLLPTGDAMVFSGSDRDEVLVPGTGTPVMVSERFDAATQTWQAMARQARPRTYHNTAMLLRDGSVLVGGHAPLAQGKSGLLHDPTFEIYQPPYFFKTRPLITQAPAQAANGAGVAIEVAGAVESVVLIRRTTLTHVIDAEQRSVLLRVLSRSGDRLALQIPDLNVAPPGPYMLFVNRRVDGMLVPSVGQALRIVAGPG